MPHVTNILVPPLTTNHRNLGFSIPPPILQKPSLTKLTNFPNSSPLRTKHKTCRRREATNLWFRNPNLSRKISTSETVHKWHLNKIIHVHGSEKKVLNGLDCNLMEKTFMDEVNDGGLLLGDQYLRFKTCDLSYSDCSLCSYAIASSKNFYTSRFLFDYYTMIVSEYLDSKRLHKIIYDSNDELRKAASIPEEDLAMVLPVYVFDLDENEQLL